MIAGIGFSSACTEDELAGLLAGTVIDVLATPAAKAAHPLVTGMAARLGARVQAISAESLAQVQARCPTRSARALRETGIASVAEGCALAAAGPGGRLVRSRIASRHATCALAEGALP